MTDPGRTTYERATRGYDPQFARAIADAVTETIAQVSRCTDANVMALRIGEIVAALVTVLAGTIALSPAVTRSPTQLRKFLDETTKRLRRQAMQAAANPNTKAVQDALLQRRRRRRPRMTATRRMADDTIERARAVPIEIEVQRRGLKLRGTTDRCGPCQRCGGHDRFSINTRKQCFHCRGCGAGGDVISLVQFLDGCDFTTAVTTLTGDEARQQTTVPAAKAPDDREREQKAAWLWSQRQPLVGSVAENYLRTRGITCPLPATLGFLPSWRDVPPRMIAAFGLCEEPEPGVIEPPRTVEAVHLTYLQPDGAGKADMPNPKQFRGAVRGKPIILAPVNDLLGLAITEGIEDALSVHQATGLGAWAAGCAGFLPALADAVPDYVESATIFAHRDTNCEGQRGALALAQKLSQRKIEIILEGF